VLGGGDWSADRLVPDAVRAWSAGRALEVRNPASVRPWQHVLEPLRGYLVLAEGCCGERAAELAEAWNFGPDERDAVPVRELVERLAAAWGAGARWAAAGAGGGAAPHEAGLLKLDCGRARARLGWAPRIDLARALELTAAWYRAFYEGRAPDELFALTVEQIRRFGSAAP
jgi:CDP-glucose 4,6-dehydratase